MRVCYLCVSGSSWIRQWHMTPPPDAHEIVCMGLIVEDAKWPAFPKILPIPLTSLESGWIAGYDHFEKANNA